jgi:energy-coupling factor transporter ATP-binding protein EcfA2
MQPRIRHLKFRHSNWPEEAPICVIEPFSEPISERRWEDDESGWALNLMVGVNGCGKTTLLKCIEMVCQENRPLHGPALTDLIKTFADLGVEYFEISVSFETEMFATGTLVNIAWEFYDDWFLDEFRKLGHKFADEREEYHACMDWFHDDGEFFDHFCISSQDMLTLNFVSKFDISNGNAEIEIIPIIHHPNFVGFEILEGIIKKTDRNSRLEESIVFPSIVRQGEALYPIIDLEVLFSQVADRLAEFGLPFEILRNDYPPIYPKVHRIQSKRVFTIDEEYTEGLRLLGNGDKLKSKLQELTSFEIEKMFKIKKNPFEITNLGGEKIGINEVYCIDDVDRVKPSSFDELMSALGSFLDDETENPSSPPYDEKTGTEFSSYVGNRQCVIFNPDKSLLIQHIKNRFCEKPGAGTVIIERLYGISQHIISSLELVNNFSPTYDFGGYLTDGQARLASLVYDILTQEYDLLLIDEPETSMHIDWQRNIVKEILEQSKYRKVPVEQKEIDHLWPTFSHVFITTHSPDVILDHLDMVTELIPQHTGVYQP